MGQKKSIRLLALATTFFLFLLSLPLLATKNITPERFTELALDCIHKEYPNKISHTLQSDSDVKPPRELYPAFFGCYDWHSSVHGHWLLTRLARLYPDNH